MSHQFETGFFAREAAWHGLGTYLDTEVPIDDALTVAGLDWRAQVVPNFLQGPLKKVVIDGVEVTVRLQGPQVPDDYSVIRDTDHYVLGKSVGRLYEPVQNKEVLEFAKAILTNSTQAVVDTAGSLHHGSIVWFLVRLQDMPYKVKGVDEVFPYLLLTNSHNGQSSFRVFPTAVRVVCANTLTLALRHGRGKGISIQHSGDIAAKLDEAGKILTEANKHLDNFYQQAELLASHSMTDDEVETFVNTLFPGGEKKQSKRTTANREAVLLNWHSGGKDVQAIPAIQGTAWEALNAVTAFTNHDRSPSLSVSDLNTPSRTLSAKVDSLWFGTASDLNQRALIYLTTLAHGGNPQQILSV